MDITETLTRLRTALADTQAALAEDAPDLIDAMVSGDPLEDASTALVHAVEELLRHGGTLPADEPDDEGATKEIQVIWRETSQFRNTFEVPTDFDLTDHDAIGELISELEHDCWDGSISTDIQTVKVVTE